MELLKRAVSRFWLMVRLHYATNRRIGMPRIPAMIVTVSDTINALYRALFAD